jgi:hypothetical protein
MFMGLMGIYSLAKSISFVPISTGRKALFALKYKEYVVGTRVISVGACKSKVTF